MPSSPPNVASRPQSSPMRSKCGHDKQYSGPQFNNLFHLYLKQNLYTSCPSRTSTTIQPQIKKEKHRRAAHQLDSKRK